MTHDSWQISVPNYFTMPCIIIIRKKRKLFYRTQGVDFMVGIITEGLLEIQVPFWTFHARLPPLGHFLPSATLIDWTRPCHPEVSDAACRLVRVVLLMMMLNMEEPTNEGSMHIRYLQILAGMERLEYVVVYWVLITNIEAILKKKVPKIVTGSF